MNVDIYDISNIKTICRALPFFARGRRMVLFLEGAAAPLITLHKAFMKWAYRTVLKTKITSQTDVIVWYLNYLFRERFQNPEDSFAIDQTVVIKNLIAFNYWEIAAFKAIGMKIYDVNEQGAEGTAAYPVRDMGKLYKANAIIIKAPPITETGDYGNERYTAEIMKVVDEYKVTFGTYIIEIQKTQ